MSAKHTPGPLEIRLSPTGSGRSLAITSKGLRIAMFDRKADANLIAAAPELLEACEAALLQEDIASSELGDQLRAAIAKAEGGSK